MQEKCKNMVMRFQSPLVYILLINGVYISQCGYLYKVNITLDCLNDVDDVEAEIVNDIIIVRINSKPMGKLINRIPDSHLLMLSLPCLPA